MIFTGFGLGLVAGLCVSLLLFTATIKLSVFYAFRVTSLLLIFFAAGLLARGIGEFINAPDASSYIGNLIQGTFGITRSMSAAQLIPYGGYITGMSWWVFFRKPLTERIPDGRKHEI
jgi:high-affinity Fe2+/Pb2+ permease